MTDVTGVTTTDRDIEFERVFNAPRPLVFKAWTEPERLKHWWGPTGWTLPVCTIDLRPGGVWHYMMRGPKGEESWGRAVYREIVEPELLVYTDAFSDANGNVNPKLPEMVVTVLFTEQDRTTRVVTRTEVDSDEQLKTLVNMGMVEGMKQTWDRLDEYLAGL